VGAFHFEFGKCIVKEKIYIFKKKKTYDILYLILNFLDNYSFPHELSPINYKFYITNNFRRPTYLCATKNNITVKIIIGLMIDYY
jgi:hypothetical protein